MLTRFLDHDSLPVDGILEDNLSDDPSFQPDEEVLEEFEDEDASAPVRKKAKKVRCLFLI